MLSQELDGICHQLLRSIMIQDEMPRFWIHLHIIPRRLWKLPIQIPGLMFAVLPATECRVLC